MSQRPSKNLPPGLQNREWLPIKALSLTSSVIRWLADSRQPRILHVFKDACNLINEQKEVLSIVTPHIGNGPFNLVLKEGISFNQHITAESSITLQANQIVLGNLQVDLHNPTIWDPRPDWEMLHAKKAAVIPRLSQTRIPEHRPAVPASLLSQLSSACVHADLPAALALVPKVTGLGNGLTPAGDDFMMGSMHGMWIIHPPGIAASLTEQIANTAAPLTTSLSAAWLRSAGRGAAGVLWHELFDALISEHQSTIQNSITRICDVGETSGLDALTGFLRLLQR